MGLLLKITFLQPEQFLWNFIYKNRQYPVHKFKLNLLMLGIISSILGLFFPISIFGLYLIFYFIGGLLYLFSRLKEYVSNKENLNDYRYQLNYQSSIKQFKEDLRINFAISFSLALFNFSVMQTSPAQEIFDGLVFIPIFILFIYFFDVLCIKLVGNLIKVIFKS